MADAEKMKRIVRRRTHPVTPLLHLLLLPQRLPLPPHALHAIDEPVGSRCSLDMFALSFAELPEIVRFCLLKF